MRTTKSPLTKLWLLLASFLVQTRFDETIVLRIGLSWAALKFSVELGSKEEKPVR